MNENKTNTTNTGKNKATIVARITPAFQTMGKFIDRTAKWLKKEILLVIGAVVVLALTLTITQATPVSRWLAAPSTNCLTQGTGNTMVEANGLVYILFGNSNSFRSYNPATGICSASALANFPSTAGTGAKLIRIDDDTLYAIAGGSSTYSYYYHIRDNFWSFYNRTKASDVANPYPVPHPSVAQGIGNSLTTVSNELYILTGAGGGGFNKYSPATNTWTALTAFPSSVSSGGAIAYPGTGSYIYALAGNSPYFYRYTIGGTWTALENAPTNVFAGGALTSIGTDLYAFGGGASRYFWKFDTTSGHWTDLTTTNVLPDAVYGGGAMTSIGNTIYAMQGDMSNGFWSLEPGVSPTWNQLAPLPESVYSGGSLTTDGTYIYATTGKALGLFYRYDPSQDSWTRLDNSHTGIGASNGYNEARGGITYVAVGPSGGPEIYLSSGQGSISSCTSGCYESLARYVIATDSWPVYYVAPNLPLSVSYGASIAHPDASDFIYTLQGGNTNGFWKFLISRNLPLMSAIGKFDAIKEIMTLVPGNTMFQGQGNSEVEANGKIYQLIGGGTYFVEYDPLLNHWRQMPAPPITINAGGALTKYDDNTLFISSGYYFLKYDIPSSTWFNFPIGKNANGQPITQTIGENDLNNSNLNQRNGSHIVEKNGILYMIVAGGTQYFSKYDPTLNKWTTLANNPGSPSYGSGSVVAGNYLYNLTGGGTTGFYRFNLDTFTWSAALSSTPAAISYGGTMGYPGTDFIYALGGNYTKNFFRYCIQNTGSGCTVGSWTNMTSTMASPKSVGHGGSMTAYNSTTLYALAGNSTQNFMRFDITNSPAQGDGTWTDLSLIDPLPQKIGSGGSLTTDGTYLYASRGENTASFYRYDPSASAGSRWSTLQNAPVNIGYDSAYTSTYGGITYSSTLGEIFAIPGIGYGGFNQSTAGPGLLFRYQLPASTGNPADDNTWTYFPATAVPHSSFLSGAALSHPAGSNYIFAFRGGNYNNFWQYDVPNNQWKNVYLSKLDDDTPLSQGTGSLTQGNGNVVVEANGELFTFTGNGTYTFNKFNPATNTWTPLANAPNNSNVHYGASLVKIDNNNLFAFQGNGYTSFWRYNIPGNSWIVSYIGYMANGAAISQAGATQSDSNAIVKANDPVTGNPLFFIIAGGYNFTFQKFDPTANTWTNLKDLPNYGVYGSALLNIGTDIYYKMHGSTSFYKYSITDNTWTTLTSSTAATYGGNNMAYPGSGDYIYVLRGNSTTFYRYSISGNSWSTLNVTPATTYAGSALTFLNSNDLYALGGNGTRNFWKYDVMAGTWDALAGNQPAFDGTVQSGGSLTTDGTYIYATVGGSANKEFWKYDPAATSGSRWTRFSDTTVGSTGNLPANMGSASTSQSRGNITLCDNCVGGGLKEIWATTGNGITGASTNDNAGLLFRFRIDPVTCDGSGLNPGTGSNACTGYNTWVHFPKPAVAPAAIYYGAALTYPGSGPLVYAFTGNSTNFRAYNMTTNVWSTLAVAPATTMGGAALTSYINGGLPDIYALMGNNTYAFRLYRVTDINTGAGSWSTFDPADRTSDATFSSGASLVYDSATSDIYATAGNNTGQVYRYNIAGNAWSATSALGATLTLPSPLTVGVASQWDATGSMTYMANGPSGGPELMLVTGNGRSGNAFGTPSTFQGLIFRYPLTSGANVGTWPLVSPTTAQPVAVVNYGGTLTSTDSDSIFAFSGNNASNFWRYDVGSNAWSTLTAPASIGAGASLTNDGSNALYATRGNPGTQNKSFYKYTISDAATGAGSWTSMAPAPVFINNSTSTAQGGIVYSPGTASAGDESVWLSPGYGASTANITTLPQLLYRYDVTTDAWPQYTPVSAPATSTIFSSGSDLVMSPDNTSIYALRGTELSDYYGSTNWSSTNSNFWKYTIGTDTWSALTNVLNNTTPKRVYSGGSITAASFTPDALYAFTGNNSKDVLVYSILGDSWVAPSNMLFPYAIGLTSTNDGGEITYSPSTQKLIGSTGTDNTSPFTIYYLDLANRAVPTLDSNWASTDGTFNILVTATDLNDSPVNVTQDTTITLSKKTGTGTLGGNLTGIIPNGNNSVVISGITYDTAETDVVITATDTSTSPTLVPADVTFTVFGPSPTITNISPDTGATTGGTIVTITGTDFVNGAYVTFNVVAAPETTFVSSTELRVITPAVNSASVPNTVDVVVVNPSEQSDTSSGGFSFDGPSISSITPDSGGTAGGTAVTISGSNFGPDNYSRELTVSNPNSDLTDFPVSFTVDTASLIAAGKMRADCGDIRILDDEYSSQLNYWIADQTCNTATTTIWVKIPSVTNGSKSIYLTYGNKLLTSHSNGGNVFQFFDDFESTTLNTSKWTATTGTPRIFDGKLILKNNDGVFAGTSPIATSTIWETLANPGATYRYGTPLRGSANSSLAWNFYANSNILGMLWYSTSLYAEAVNTYTEMSGGYAISFKNYKVVFRPNDLNEAVYFYNNGAATTINNVTPLDTLYPSLYVNSGSYDAQWEYIFIRPYGGTTDPSITVGAETGGALRVAFSATLAPVFATDVEFINDTTVRAVTPANSIGLHDTIIYNADNRFDTLTSSYTNDAPTVTDVTPDIGTTDGGDTITINGTNFTEGGFHKPVSILNKSASTLTNQTLYFTLDTATLITAGKMQSACQDIRVKDSDHVTYLNYWVEGCNSSLTHVWTTLSSIPPEGKTIYVHYGNPNYVSTATPENFFPTLAGTNNKLWLNSIYGITLTSGFVSGWNDLSGNGNNVAVSTSGGLMPAYNTMFQNGISAVSFDGTDDYLSRTGFNNLPVGNTDRSVFMVNRYDNTGYGGFAYGNNATLATFGLVVNDYGYLGVQGWGTDYMTSANAVTYLGILLHEAVLNSLSLTQWQNGTSIYGPTVTAFNTATTKIEIGREMDASPYKDMDLFEVIVFNKALSTTERQEIENYINLKYDLNNNIQTTTYTGTEIGSANTFSTYIEALPTEPFASFNFVDSSHITAVTAAHAPATVDITVTTPDAQTATGFGVYTFADPPTIASIDPVTGVNNNGALSVDVIGTNITALTELKLSKTDQTDIVCTNYSNVTDTTLTCDFNIQNASIGDWNVDIYTPDITPGANSSLADGFNVTQAPPEITGFDPSGGSVLGGNTVTITGNYFVYKGGNYTTPFTINNTGGAENNYPVALTLNTSAPIAAGHMRSDCGDIRVYANHDYTIPVPYYIESGCNTATTVIWAKVPTIAANATTTIYVNYGIPARTSESNGNNVFLFFDDFEGASLDTSKWVVGGYANWILETADRYQGTNSSKSGPLPSYAYNTSYIASKNGSNLINVPTGKTAIIDMHWKVSSYANYDYLYYCKSDDDTTLPSCTMSSGYDNRITGTVSWTREQSTATPLSAGPHRIKFAYETNYYTGGSNTGWIDDVKVRLYSASIGNSVAGTELVEQNSPLVVTFDTTDATNVTYLNSSTITATAPAHAAGLVDITVTNPDLQSDVSPTQYLYAEPPTIISIDPVTGVRNDSSVTVTIAGTYLVNPPSAYLTQTGQDPIYCGASYNFVDGSPDTFQCDFDLTGAATGDWNVVLENPDQQTATLTDGFAITLPPPNITGVDPDHGPSAGGTLVVISGTDFAQVTNSSAYKVPVTVTNSGAEQTDFQVQFTLNTSALITGGKMRSDCGDLRVYADSDLTVSMPYYLESGCNTTSTVFWTRVPVISGSGNTTFYLSYGDPTLTGNSNGNTVFYFFDNFEGGSIDSNKWVVGGSVNWIIEAADRFEGTYSSKNGPGVPDSGNSYIASKDGSGLINIPSGNVGIIDFYWKVSSEGNYDFNFYCKSDDDSTLPSCSRQTNSIDYISGTVAWVREISNTAGNAIPTTLSSGLHRIMFAYGKDGSGVSGSDTAWIDLVKVRAYSASIGNGSIGTEEPAIKNPVVTFDGVEGTNLVYLNTTTLEVETPPGVGLVNVAVTNPDLQSDTLTDGYTYLSPPTVTSIDPASGYTTDAPFAVTIYGTDFQATPTAKLAKLGETDITCTNPRNFVDASPDHFDCDLDLSGATSDGDWDVVVTNPDTQTGTLIGGFTIYYPAPTISAVNPDHGFSAGGTLVTITGTNFYEGGSVATVEYPITYTPVTPLTDYQVELSLNTQYLAGDNMRGDCYDIRAFDEDATTSLDYYIQNLSACGTSTPLSIWVQVPSIANPGKSVYLKYGDPAWTTNDSNATNTFVAAIPNSIAEWKMDDLTGSTVTDSSTNGNNGTAVGTTIVDGKFGKARSFQGDADYINFGVKASLHPSGATAEHTIEAWVKLEASQDAYPTLFNLWEESSSDPMTYDKSYLVDFYNQGVRYFLENAPLHTGGSTTVGGLGLFDNNWHHIVTTNDRVGSTNYLSIYVDGVRRTNVSIGDYGMRTVLPAINLRMARQWWSFNGGFQGLWGLIDSTRMYNRALTQEEITALFNNYGFLDPATGTILVSKYTTTPPTVGAGGAPVGGSPRVTFDGADATNVTLINDTTLEATTPPGTGLVDVVIYNPDSQSDTLTDAYTYIEPPTILSITPDTGHNQESLTGVVITGTDLVATPTVTLYIGEIPLSCTNVTFVNSAQVTCDLDLNGADAGTYDVEIMNPDSQTDRLIGGFEVTYPQPTITDIDPAIGHVDGGEMILITGTYFEDGATVDFDGTYSPSVLFIGPTQLEVTTPAHAIGLKDVTVTNPAPGNMTVTATDGYEYIDPPIVTSIVPDTGSNDQSALAVTISGSNFGAALSAKLTKAGQTDIICGAAYNFIDGSPDDSFQCNFNISDAVTGLWDLIVTNGNNQVSEPLVDGFEITYAPPTVTSIINNEVASGSTQQVTVGGTNLYSEDPDFITIDIGGTGGVGGTPCTTPVVINPNSVTCYLPALTAGTYDVTVTTGAGTDTAEDLITYFDAPTVTDVDPNHGLTIGGTEVTITGTNFFGTPTIFFQHSALDESEATNIIVVNSTTITATTPPNTEGLVDVKVVTEAGSDTLDNGYTYEAPPVDPDASSLEIFGYRIEPINTTYYDNNNLSPVHASLIQVTAIETLTGNPIIGRTVTISADPATDLLIHSADCDNLYSSTPGSSTLTDSYGTACFLFWSTATPSFTATSSEISATIDGSGSYGPVVVTDTATLEIESMAITSVLNYRFRNDDGTELTATPIANTSIPYYNAQNELAFRLRFGLTRNMPLASSFARNDEFTPSANAEIGPRPLPAASPDGLSSFRAFPAYELNNNTGTLYIATPNRADSKARVYKFDLSDLTQAATYFEFPGTVNFTPVTDDDPDAPIDGATHMITKMFIDEDNDLMYFVITPYFDDIGRTKVYKINLLTETVVDVLAEAPYSLKGTLDSEIDLNNGFLYLTAGKTISSNDNLQPIGIQKISLNGPTEPMTMVGELLLENTYDNITSSVIDLTNQFLYVTVGLPQKIIKIDLDVSTSLPPVKVDEIALAPITADSPIEKVGIQAGVIDPVNGYAYFASSSDFTHPDYDNNQLAFLTKVDIDPARDFEVVSRLSLTPPSPTSDYNYNAEYVYMSPIFTNFRLFPFASIDQVNGYAYFPVARLNPIRDLFTWKLMRIHLDTFTRDSLYDEMNYSDLNSTTIKGSVFRPETGRGYIVRETADGDILTEFNSTTRQNLKLQSSPNVDPEYCNFTSAASYIWSDLPNADFTLADSANFTDGAATSNVTGLLYDNNDHFTAGQLKDTSATTGRITMGANEMTEIEYSIVPTSAAAGSYCFRLVDADPANQNQVSGNPNLLYNIITSEFEVANFHHYVPLTINGVILEKNEVNVVEGTTTDSYGIKLATQPTADVTVSINADDARLTLTPDLTPLTPTETILTFTTENWDTYQYVTASAADNGTVNGTTTEPLRHTTVSTDPGYDNLIVEPVTSIVTDYGATFANVLATVSGTITFTPPGDFSFPAVNSGTTAPNFSPSLTVNIDEGRGTSSDFILTLQADQFCRAQGVCIPLTGVYAATSNLINAFNSFDASQIGLFLANYLQSGETLDNRDTYVHVDPGQDRPLSAPITLIDSRNVPSGNSENPLQGSIDFDLNLMIDFANLAGISQGTYRTLLTIDLNANPL